MRALILVMCGVSLGLTVAPREAQGFSGLMPLRSDTLEDSDAERFALIEGAGVGSLALGATMGLASWITADCLYGINQCSYRGVYYTNLAMGSALGASAGLLWSSRRWRVPARPLPVFTGALLGAATGVAMSHTVYRLAGEPATPDFFSLAGPLIWIGPAWLLSTTGAYLGYSLTRPSEPFRQPRVSRTHEVLLQSGVSLGATGLLALNLISYGNTYGCRNTKGHQGGCTREFANQSITSFMIAPLLMIGSVQGVGIWNGSGGSVYGSLFGSVLSMMAVQIPAFILQGDACGQGGDPNTCAFARPARITHASLLMVSGTAGAVLGYQLTSTWKAYYREQRRLSPPSFAKHLSLGLSPLAQGGAMESVGFQF